MEHKKSLQLTPRIQNIDKKLNNAQSFAGESQFPMLATSFILNMKGFHPSQPSSTQ